MKTVSLIVAFSFFFLLGCDKTNESSLMSSTNPFEILIEKNAYPVNKLSKNAINEFNSLLQFDDEGEMISGYYATIENELNDEEFNLFFNQLFDAEITFVDGEEFERIQQEENIYRSCTSTYFQKNKKNCPNFTGGKCYTISGYWCRKCTTSPHQDGPCTFE